MSTKIHSVITGSGAYVPPARIKGDHFLSTDFYDVAGKRIEVPNKEIISKFLEITTIEERRYVTDDLVTSDIAYFAAVEALESSKVDKEQLDYIVVAHNFGDVAIDSGGVDMVPCLAARVKQKLEIMNPDAVAYDLPFGCPGWLQAVIQADYFIRSGDAKKVLVIGAEVLSRVLDPHDRDGMLYADGAGAVVLEAIESDTPVGILAHKARSDTFVYSKMLYMGKSNKPSGNGQHRTYLKMNGRKLYQYALETVPLAIKSCLEKSDTPIESINKVLIHQANGKMDDAILKRLYGLYGINEVPAHVMPMTVSWLGNSSVATLPTLLDLILKGRMEGQKIEKGDTIVFASVGAGMNVNALVYKA